MEPKTEKARELQREYLRRWRAKNKEKVRRYNQEYWKRKAAEREETNALYLYAPQGDGHSTDLLPNKNYRGIDYGRPTSTDVSIAVAGAKALEGTLREIQERWSAHVQPTITKTEDLPADEVKDIVSAAARKTPDAVTVDQNGTEAEDEARRMGAEMAEANRKANEGLQYYINGGRSV